MVDDPMEEVNVKPNQEITFKDGVITRRACYNNKIITYIVRFQNTNFDLIIIIQWTSKTYNNLQELMTKS
jgi:hypothetical protein